MFPRQPPPMQWAPRDYAAYSATALRPRGAPALASGQGNQWIAPSRPPFPPQQQFGGSPQVPPRPTGYPVAHVSPGAPQGRYGTSLVSAEGNSDVQFLGYKRPPHAGTSMQPVTGNKVQEEIREFMEVMQQHRYKMQAPHHSQVDQIDFQNRNSAYFQEMRRKLMQYQSRLNSAVNPQHSPGPPCNQSNKNAQYDPNQSRASSASPESASVEVNFADSRLSFKIPVLRRDPRSAYSSSRALRNSVSNIESPSCVESITSSQTIKTSPVTSPDPLCNMQNWSAPNAASVHPTRPDSNPYPQPPESTRLTHENNEPVTNLGSPQATNAHFQNQAVGDPTVSSTIRSPVSLEPEEPPTTNEKTALTENAVDARKPSDPVPSDPTPKANVFKPPRRMFSRKGKCLSGLFRKTPQGFPHVSFDFEVNCFLCNRMAAGNNVYEHMFFGNLKCIECGHVVRSCEDFKIVRHSNVECGASKRKHRLASWADCPVEFLVYSLEQSLVSNRTEDCAPPSTCDVTDELENYMKKLSLLRFYKPWKSAFRKCSEYVKSMNKPEDAQEAISREEVASVIPGDTEEETKLTF
ncbi:hypothetical protein C7M84_011972 [Penaeus vannamei]|uniref:Uncharacterized protein n=1 Tax=Penaeus vannamei TaxID=6689 RepID=A0A3R7NXY9_PENVA|nr:hypothetical protein C7M84_011972 [Penaeus vannamei]